MTDYQIDHNLSQADVVTVDITTTVPLETMKDFVQAHGIDPRDLPCPSTVSVVDGHLTVETCVREGADQRIVRDGDKEARQRITVKLQAPWPPQPCAGAGYVHTDRSGWFADVDPEEAPSDDHQWQPCLQVGVTGIHSFDVWFRTEQECEDYIRRHIIGQELLPRG